MSKKTKLSGVCGNTLHFSFIKKEAVLNNFCLTYLNILSYIVHT